MAGPIRTRSESDRFGERVAQLRVASEFGAVITTDVERAAAENARAQGERLGGDLSGWTLAVKDNIHVAGLPSTAGTPALHDFVPDTDAASVSLLRRAGAIVLAKANMHELAFGATSNNPRFGAVRNPSAPDHSAGGSSGGTAVLIATGACRIGLGTDTGGSVRVPAAVTGIVGFRPSTGRYPLEGVAPLSSVRDTVGTMAMTVADVIAVDGVLRVPEPPRRIRERRLPRRTSELVLGVPTTRFAHDLDETVARQWTQALAILSDAGVTVVAVDLDTAVQEDDEWGMAVVMAEARSRLAGYLRDNSMGMSIEQLLEAAVSEDVRKGMAGLVTDAVESNDILTASRAARRRAQARYDEVFQTVDAIAFPTTPAVAPLLGREDDHFVLNGREVDTFSTLIRNTSPGSFAGVPGLSLPLPRREDELPSGLALDAARGADSELLSIGELVEKTLEPYGRRAD